MSKDRLNFLDATFLKLESPRQPFHVGALLLLKLPPKPPKQYLQKLARSYSELPQSWPILNRRLKNPENLRNPSWVMEKAIDAERHVLHYALPEPGRIDDLLRLVSRAHERQLDRSRPMWETHIIEGLPGGRFAVYCKMHHSLVDGIGGIRLIMHSLLNPSPQARLADSKLEDVQRDSETRADLLGDVAQAGKALLGHYQGIPDIARMCLQIGLDAIRGEEAGISIPFTAPRTPINAEIDSSRHVILCDLPLTRAQKIARRAEGSINDVLLAVYGGALRSYLKDLGALPRKTLIAAVPVSLKSAAATDGTQISTILCPYFTNEPDPVKRLRQIIKVTKKAKFELGKMSTTAGMDFANLMMVPFSILILSGTSTKFTPEFNTVLSNVKGSTEKLYLEGSEVEGVYPLSVVMDGSALNVTVISYRTRLFFGITSCPTPLPGVESFGEMLKASFQELQDAVT